MKTPPPDSVIINVCVIPPASVGVACVEMSKSLASSDTMFALDGEKKFAHMTVAMMRCGKDMVQKMIAAIEAAVKSASRFACDHTGYFMTAGRYLEVSYRRSEDFMQLHEAILAAASSFRLNPAKPFEEAYFTPYTPQQQKNAEETGYDLARELYRPHVTLTRYYEGRVPEVFPGFVPAKLSFVMGTICVYEADDNGAVTTELARFTV